MGSGPLAEPLPVWVITDGVPGHEARSRGILAALARLRPVAAEWVPGRLRNRLSRAVMAAAMAGGRRPPGWLLRACHRMVPPATAPGLVLGAGGRTQFLALALAEAHGVPALFAGLPAWIDARRFTAVIVPYPLPGLANVIVLEVPVSAMSPATAAEAGATLRAGLAPPVWTLLAGGDGGGYRYTADEWRALGEGLAAQARVAGATLTLSTSRRTGAQGEAALRAGLGDFPLAQAVWWDSGDRDPVLPLIGAADLVFVTADSASMAGEAVAAGRPVVLLSPRHARPAPRHAALFERLAQRRRVAALPITGLAEAELPRPESFSPLPEPPVATMARALGPMLGW